MDNFVKNMKLWVVLKTKFDLKAMAAKDYSKLTHVNNVYKGRK